MAQGNFGNPKEHAKAGSMSHGGNSTSSNRSKQSKAGKKGAEAQPLEGKILGGENSHIND